MSCCCWKTNAVVVHSDPIFIPLLQRYRVFVYKHTLHNVCACLPVHATKIRFRQFFKFFINALQMRKTHCLFMRNNEFQKYKMFFFIFHVDFVLFKHLSLLIEKVFFLFFFLYRLQRTIFYLSTSVDKKTRLLDEYRLYDNNLISKTYLTEFICSFTNVQLDYTSLDRIQKTK